MRLALQPHPDFPCAAVKRLEAEVARTADGLSLRYRLEGALDALAIPAPGDPARADELWRHTCFEAFVAGAGEGYCEFNLAPSREWAAYRFDRYREGMAPLEVPAPAVEVRRRGGVFELAAELAFQPPQPARLNLTAVIEAADGQVSYWALAHPAGRPDFHAPDCLRLQLPATESP